MRSIATHPEGEILLSGSVDKTSKIFNINNRSGKYEFQKEISYHDGFVLSTTPM